MKTYSNHGRYLLSKKRGWIRHSLETVFVSSLNQSVDGKIFVNVTMYVPVAGISFVCLTHAFSGLYVNDKCNFLVTPITGADLQGGFVKTGSTRLSLLFCSVWLSDHFAFINFIFNFRNTLTVSRERQDRFWARMRQSESADLFLELLAQILAGVRHQLIQF